MNQVEKMRESIIVSLAVVVLVLVCHSVEHFGNANSRLAPTRFQLHMAYKYEFRRD